MKKWRVHFWTCGTGAGQGSGQARSRTPTALTSKVGPVAGRESPMPVAVLAPSFLWVFTLVEDIRSVTQGPSLRLEGVTRASQV